MDLLALGAHAYMCSYVHVCTQREERAFESQVKMYSMFQDTASFYASFNPFREMGVVFSALNHHYADEMTSSSLNSL